ncbi:response regulator [Bradyrhizobium sp. CB1650]|uniref:response regulator transcription factor n=1 Tax=Bradyrhizobium sp. CB1650 TaxID=3039153 RepID=UPI0024352784|nr:response regulator [Bradyrhizobium sp. CB1650]WGD50334.1 response regulator [Bradyrhizobium sp. CB1650]
MTIDRPLVAVIDSDDSLREDLQALLGAATLAVELFNSAEDFLKMSKFRTPNCIVLDVRLPGMSGLDLRYRQAKVGRKTPFVFLTAHNEVGTSVRAMKAGAIDYLIKPFQDKELLDAVNRGIEYDREQRLQKQSFDELRTRLKSLSPRERETMVLLSAGQGPKQIAGKLGICTHTARVHSSRIMYKMGARSIADLVRMADKLEHRPGNETIRSHDIPLSGCCGAARRNSNARKSCSTSAEERRSQSMTPASLS